MCTTEREETLQKHMYSVTSDPVTSIKETQTWCVGVCFRDVRCGEFEWLPLAPYTQLFLGHLGF